MSDIVERLHTVSRGDHGDCMGREYICTCGFDDAAWDAAEEAAAEITRLRAERDEARDKALDEAAEACDSHRYGDSFLDSCHLRKEHRQDITQAIRALKSPKPQED